VLTNHTTKRALPTGSRATAISPAKIDEALGSADDIAALLDGV